MFAVLSQFELPTGKALLVDGQVQLLPFMEWRYVEA